MYKQTYYFSKQTFKTFLSETLFWPENNGEVSNRSNFYLIFFFYSSWLVHILVRLNFSLCEGAWQCSCLH